LAAGTRGDRRIPAGLSYPAGIEIQESEITIGPADHKAAVSGRERDDARVLVPLCDRRM